MILLDTCVVSEIASASPAPAVVAWFDATPEESLWLSVLTLGEIQKGIDRLDPGARQQRLAAWLDGLATTFGDRILPVDRETAIRWGHVSAACLKVGRPRPAIDTLLAATALRHGLAIATRNTYDFADTTVAIVDPWVHR